MNKNKSTTAPKKSTPIFHSPQEKAPHKKRSSASIFVTNERSLGAILREERLRLGMTQVDFADIGGVNQRTQVRYEQDDGVPDGAYLRALAKIGVDVQYVLTGVRTVSVVTEDEQKLLSIYKSLDYYGKGGVWGVINGLISAQQTETNKKTNHH